MDTVSPLPVPRYLQEEEVLTEECRDLLQTLPRERGWISNHVYLYQGFWIPPGHLPGLLACREHHQARDTDTVLVTYPKSGTTWLKAMAYALVTRTKIHPQRDHSFVSTNPHDLVPNMELQAYGAPNSNLPDHFPATTRIFGTHAPLTLLPRTIKSSSCKIVYLTRDPKDVFVSLWPEGRSPNKLEEMFDKFCDSASVYGPFWGHVLGYWNESMENPHKVLFLRYEDFKDDPAGRLRMLAEFLGCPFSPEEEAEGVADEITRLCSFESLRNMEGNKAASPHTGMLNEAYFRKAVVGGWGEVLTPEMAKRLDRITEEKMNGSGYKF